MKEVELLDVLPEILGDLGTGAFLTVKNGDKVNTMTIGWGTAGRVWNKEVFTLMVRYSRYTHELIKDADSFTVSFPKGGELEKELDLMGKKSGRDIDKYQEANMKLHYIDELPSPILDIEGIHLGCKILYRQSMAPENLAREIDKEWYEDKDYHMVYYGEILKVWER